MALRDKLMRRDLFEDFCREFVRELNWLRMEHRAGLSSAPQSSPAHRKGDRSKLVQAIKEASPRCRSRTSSCPWKRGKRENCRRGSTLRRCRPLLHPRMADVYREKVGSLCSALETRRAARSL